MVGDNDMTGDQHDVNNYKIDFDLIIYPINEKFLIHCIELAENNKRWAKSIKIIQPKGIDETEEIILDKTWWEKASNISKEMVDEYIQKEIGQMAAEIYNYKYYRSHLKTEIGLYLDPTAKRYWEKVTGETLS